MSILTDAIDDIVTDPDLTVTVSYEVAGSTPVQVLAIAESCRRDYASADGVSAISGAKTFYIRKASLSAEPRRGHVIRLAGAAYDVHSPVEFPGDLYAIDAFERRSVAGS